MNWVRFSTLTDAEYRKIDEADPINQFGQSLWGYNVDIERLIPIFCQKLNMFTVN
jgi:hypothetical protein